MTIAIVTGAASGIGYALAEAMVRRGDTVVHDGTQRHRRRGR